MSIYIQNFAIHPLKHTFTDFVKHEISKHISPSYYIPKFELISTWCMCFRVLYIYIYVFTCSVYWHKYQSNLKYQRKFVYIVHFYTLHRFIGFTRLTMTLNEHDILKIYHQRFSPGCPIPSDVILFLGTHGLYTECMCTTYNNMKDGSTRKNT